MNKIRLFRPYSSKACFLCQDVRASSRAPHAFIIKTIILIDHRSNNTRLDKLLQKEFRAIQTATHQDLLSICYVLQLLHLVMHSVSEHCMKNKVPGCFYSIYVFLRPHGAFIRRCICTIHFCLCAYGSIISFKPAKKVCLL